MSVEAVGLLLGIAIVFGSIGEALAGYTAGNFFVRTGLGFIGAVIGSWLPYRFGMPVLQALAIGDTTIPVVWSIACSALVVAVFGAIWGQRSA